MKNLSSVLPSLILLGLSLGFSACAPLVLSDAPSVEEKGVNQQDSTLPGRNLDPSDIPYVRKNYQWNAAEQRWYVGGRQIDYNFQADHNRVENNNYGSQNLSFYAHPMRTIYKEDGYTPEPKAWHGPVDLSRKPDRFDPNKPILVYVHGFVVGTENRNLFDAGNVKPDWNVMAYGWNSWEGPSAAYTGYGYGLYQGLVNLIEAADLEYTEIRLAGFSYGGNMVATAARLLVERYGLGGSQSHRNIVVTLTMLDPEATKVFASHGTSDVTAFGQYFSSTWAAEKYCLEYTISNTYAGFLKGKQIDFMYSIESQYADEFKGFLNSGSPKYSFNIMANTLDHGSTGEFHGETFNHYFRDMAPPSIKPRHRFVPVPSYNDLVFNTDVTLVGDVGRSEAQDLVFVRPDLNQIHVMLSTDNGFQLNTMWGAGVGSYPRVYLLGNFSAYNNKDDLIEVYPPTGTVYLWSPKNSGDGFNGYTVFTGGLSIPYPGSGVSFRVGDIDGNGFDDIAVLQWGSVYAYFSDGQSFGPQTWLAAGLDSSNPSWDLANMDGLQGEDIVQTHPSGNYSLKVFLSNGDRTVGSAQSWGFGFSIAPRFHAFGNIDDNAGADALEMYPPNGNIYGWSSLGTNLSSYSVWSGGIKSGPKYFFGDFTGDHRMDILETDAINHTFRLWKANGTTYDNSIIWHQ